MSEQTINIKKRQEILRMFFIDSGVYDSIKIANKLGISVDTYFKTLKEMSKLVYYEKQEELKKQKNSSALYQRLKYDHYQQTENFLIRLYQHKSITDSQAERSTIILKILNEKGELSKPELLTEIRNTSLTKDSDVIDFTEQFKRYMPILVQSGLVEAFKKPKKRETFYRLNYLFEKLDEVELLELYYFIEFHAFSEVPSALGFLLLERLKRHLLLRQFTLPEHLQLQLFKYAYFGKVLDEYMYYELATYIKAKQSIYIKYFSVKEQKKEVALENESIENNGKEIIPLQVIFDDTFCRWYLIGRDIQNPTNTFQRYRLDYITEVISGNNIPDSQFDSLKVQAMEELKTSWCVSNDPLTNVKIKFLFNNQEDKENFILKKVQEQGQWGVITENNEDGSFIWEIQVNGTDEIKPWIRSFGKSAVVLEPVSLRNEIIEDWKEILARDGFISEG